MDRVNSTTQYGYMKFFKDGYMTRGIADNVDQMRTMAHADKPDFSGPSRYNIMFSVKNDTLYVELYSGYNHEYEYDVYKIRDINTLEMMGTSKKIGKTIRTTPQSSIYQFTKF